MNINIPEFQNAVPDAINSSAKSLAGFSMKERASKNSIGNRIAARDVAEAGFCMTGPDPERDQSPCIRFRHTLDDRLEQGAGINDVVVARQDQQDGMGIGSKSS